MKMNFCKHTVKYFLLKSVILSFILAVFLPDMVIAGPSGKQNIAPEKMAESASTRKLLENSREREMLSYKSVEADIDKLVISAVKDYRNAEFEKAISTYREAKRELEKLRQRVLKLEGLQGKELSESISKYSEMKHVKRLNEKIDACNKAIARSYRYWAQAIYFDAEKFADLANFDEAISKCDEAIAVYPECKDEMEKAKAHYRKLRERIKDNKDFEDSVSDKEDKKKVNLLIRKGEVFYSSGQWEKARDMFEQALSADPYNERSIDFLRKISVKLSEIGRRRMDLVHSERIVESGWSALTPIISYKETADAGMTSEDGINKESEESPLQKKLKNIILKSGIDFPDSPLSAVIATLIQYSKDYDTDKDRNGVNIVALGKFNTAIEDDENQDGANNNAAQGADGAAVQRDPTVTLSIFSPISLEDAIKRVCQNIKAVYKVNIEDGVVEIAPDIRDLDDVLQTEYFELSNVLNPASLLAGDKSIHDAYFAAVPRPEGAYTAIDTSAGRLIVTNTPENIKAMKKIFEKINRSKPQILIQAKFVDVIMKDLEELGFQYTFSRTASNEAYAKGSDMKAFTYTGGDTVFFDNKEYNIYVKPPADTDPKNANWYQFYKTTSSLPLLTAEKQIIDPNTGQTYNRGDEDINITYYYKDAAVSQSSVTWGKNSKLTRIYDMAGTPVTEVNKDTNFGKMWEFDAFNNKGYGLNAQVYALDQAGASDLLYCPRITTMDGSPATLDMVVTKEYPEDWEEPTISLMDNVPVFMGSVPDTEEEEEGILFTVTPQLDQNEDPNYETVYLDFNQLRLKKFSGWDDYSYSLPIDDGSGNYVNFPNIVRMPIFQERTINTKVSCRDGATVVIGGMINDESSVINDKYPILGDIPLIGRFFQSKGRNTYKSNLLIFVTCRLVLPDGSPFGSREESGTISFRY